MSGYLRKIARMFSTLNGRSLLLPLDHGAHEGMIPGLANIPGLIDALPRDAVQGVILNKGLARHLGPRLAPHHALIVQLSGGTKHGLPPYNKTIVCSVSEALRLGADAVSILVNLGNDLEDRMLSDLGLITDEAHQVGLPVLATLSARGGQIVNERDASLIAHCIRLGGELGADLVSVPYSGDAASFGAAVAASPIPVLVAGGPLQSDFEAFTRGIAEALKCGAKGALVGRNIFQHKKPLTALSTIAALISGE